MAKQRKYWHVTPIENLTSIEKNGLNADNDGYIYLISDLECKEEIFGQRQFIPDEIALFQVFIETYILIEVDSAGITKRIIADNVSENTAWAQRRVKQTNIDPVHLTQIEKRDVDVYAAVKFYECMFLGRTIYSHDTVRDLKEQGKLPMKIPKKLQKHIDDRFDRYTTEKAKKK